jgi:hypothetical protein
MSQPIEFCCHNPLCCFSTSNIKGQRIFRYGFSPDAFGYTLVGLLTVVALGVRLGPKHHMSTPDVLLNVVTDNTIFISPITVKGALLTLAQDPYCAVFNRLVDFVSDISVTSVS